MKNSARILGFAILAGVLAQGCAKKKNDISQVATDAYLLKQDLTGCATQGIDGSLDPVCAKTYSAVKTIVSADEKLDGAGVIPGFHADLGFVQFVVTEKQLLVRRVGEPDKVPSTSTVVASFPITKHFDIKRDVNDFGEATNKIIEDEKKPWNERAYIRVDLSTNGVSQTNISSIFATQIKEEGAKVVSPLVKDGGLLSFDVDATISQTDSFSVGDTNQAEPYAYNSFRAHIKNTFLEVKPSDYKPYEMSNEDFARFGYFRTFENFLDPERGATISGHKLLANRFNVCENNAKTAGLSCATNKIVYTLNAGFPEEFKQPAREVIAAWNKSFQKALDRNDDVVVLDESVSPEIGDTRYNMIAGVDEKLPTGLLGVSQTVNNPNTGETLSARASVYLGTVRLEGSMAGESLDLLVAQSSTGGGSVVADSASLLVKQVDHLSTLHGRFMTAGPVNPNLLVPRANTIQYMSKALKENAGEATDRRMRSYNILGSHLNVSDPTWSSVDPQKAIATLKNMISASVTKVADEQRQQLRGMSQTEKGIHSAEFVEPAVEQYIRKFVADHKGQSADQIRDELKTQVRKLVFYTTLIHEMGHNFGLRHNFISSSDVKNYTDKYYELEKQKQALAANDPKRRQITLDQESYSYSSVMDYTSNFNETMGGTGPYDDAAIRFAYNTSIDKNKDSITSVSHNYKFCTDHQINEDLMCRQFDRGPNVNQSVANAILDYGNNYYFKNFRRDRATFGGPSGYFTNIITRVMFPMRQVADELIYQIMQSPRVAASGSLCDLGFLKASVDAGEIANLCDSDVVQKYASQVNIRGLMDFGVFLLNDDLKTFRKDPSLYQANGFADLLYANIKATNFFVSVIGTPEPGLYFYSPATSSIEAVPDVVGSEDDRLLAYLTSKGLSADQAQAVLPQARGNLVNIPASSQAKYLMSRVVQDGSFQRVEVMGNVYDKLAAIIMMGARGLPVQKYQQKSMNGNYYFYPQTQAVSVALMNALINQDPQIAKGTMITRSGKMVTGTLPASMSLDTQMYGLITGITDFISTQDGSFGDRLKICDLNEKDCVQDANHDLASFKSATGGDTYSAIQAKSGGDSIVFELVSKGAEISKARDQAFQDIANKPALTAQTKALGAKAGVPEKTFLALLKEKSPALADQLTSIYGDDAQSMTSQLIETAKKVDKLKPDQALNIQQAVQSTLEQVQGVIEDTLGKNDSLLAQVKAAAAPADKELTDIASLDVRVAASEQLRDQASNQIAPIQSQAETIRTFMNAMNSRQ